MSIAQRSNRKRPNIPPGNWQDQIIREQTFPHVHQDQGLDLALERMGANQIDVLPVVSRADLHELEGIVTLRDVLDSYGVGQGGRG